MAQGGKREGAGRPKGAVSQNTATLREMARKHAGDALKVLHEIAQTGESEAARVSAANALLDRGYGKPSTVLTGDENGGPLQFVGKVILEGVRPSGNS